MAKDKSDLLKAFNAGLAAKIEEKYTVSDVQLHVGADQDPVTFRSTMVVATPDGKSHNLLVDHRRGIGQDSFRVVVNDVFQRSASLTFWPWRPGRFTDSKKLQAQAQDRIFHALDQSLQSPRAAGS